MAENGAAATAIGLPESVLLVDVGPRDGLQNEAQPVSTGAKVALVNDLARAGVPRIEVTSFVSPRAVPQMADAAEVMAAIERREGTEYAVLVPNARGLERAVLAGADIVNVVVCASESFNQRNVRMSVAESMAQTAEIVRLAGEAGVRVTAVLGTAFFCPFEGRVAAERVLDLIGQCADLGIVEVTLADTIGAADPAQVYALAVAARERGPRVELGIHLHDTRGLGLANALAALQAGVRRLEASVGGIGGCPFAPKATGNVCSEDLVFMLEAMGVATGVDLERLIEVAGRLPEVVGHPVPSRMLAAGPRGVQPVPAG